jgi:integrase/predicted DNA-binding transcriptional regulator AlpA
MAKMPPQHLRQAELCEGSRPQPGVDDLGIPNVVHVEHLAELLHCTPKAIRSRASAGQLPKPWRDGKRLAWTREAIRSWLSDRSRSASQADRVHITITKYSHKGKPGLQAIWKMQHPNDPAREIKTTSIVPDGMDRGRALAWAQGQIGSIIQKLLAKAGMAANESPTGGKNEPSKPPTTKAMPTFKEFCEDRFIPEHVMRQKESTQDGYLRVLADNLKAFSDLPINVIDEERIARFFASCSQFAPGTKNNWLMKLRMVLRLAKKAGLIAQVPEVELFPDPRPNIIVFNEDEIETIIQVAEDTDDHVGVAVLLALDGGLRISEICALKWEDIDFKNGLIKVRRSVYKNKEQLPKNNEAAPLAMSDRLKEALLAHRKREPLGPRVVARWMVKKKCWAQLDQRTGYKWFTAAAMKATGRKGNPHLMRHTSITHLGEIGVDPADIQAHARHKHYSTTERYLHTCKVKGSRRAAARLDEARSKRRSKAIQERPTRSRIAR